MESLDISVLCVRDLQVSRVDLREVISRVVAIYGSRIRGWRRRNAHAVCNEGIRSRLTSVVVAAIMADPEILRAWQQFERRVRELEMLEQSYHLFERLSHYGDLGIHRKAYSHFGALNNGTYDPGNWYYAVFMRNFTLSFSGDSIIAKACAELNDEHLADVVEATLALGQYHPLAMTNGHASLFAPAFLCSVAIQRCMDEPADINPDSWKICFQLSDVGRRRSCTCLGDLFRHSLKQLLSWNSWRKS